MKTRILTAIGIIVFGLPILFLSEYIVYPIALGLLSLCAIWELLRAFGMHKNYVIAVPTYIVALCMPIFGYGYFFGPTEQINYLLICGAVMFCLLLYYICVAVFSRGRLGYRQVSAVFTLMFYITVSFTSMTLIRYTVNGVYFFGMVYIASWICDVFAYFVGMLFGKHKLAPELSPKKTIEGAIGGVVFSALTFLLYGLVVENFFPVKANYLVLALLGIVLPIVSQIGDLWASLIKREHNIKDYSNILPGHGGIIDRFDSVFSTCTILLAVCVLAPPFVSAVV